MSALAGPVDSTYSNFDFWNCFPLFAISVDVFVSGSKFRLVSEKMWETERI